VAHAENLPPAAMWITFFLSRSSSSTGAYWFSWFWPRPSSHVSLDPKPYTWPLGRFLSATCVKLSLNELLLLLLLLLLLMFIWVSVGVGLMVTRGRSLSRV